MSALLTDEQRQHGLAPFLTYQKRDFTPLELHPKQLF